METLYGLSIRQPWLEMIVRGVKTIEIREWAATRRGIIALHASRTIDFGTAYYYGYESPLTLPRGKIVAIAELVDVLKLESSSWHLFLKEHRQPSPMVDGAYGFLLKNVRTLEHPVACWGRPKFFPLPENVAERVRRFARL